MKKLLTLIMAVAICVSIIPLNVFAITANAPIKMVGDLDLDEEITDWDGVLLARYLAGWGGIFDSMVMDVDGDGEITDWDGVIFDRMLAGWSVDSNVGNPLSFTVYYYNTFEAQNPNPTIVGYGNEEIPLLPLSLDHHIFRGWYIWDAATADYQEIDSIPANYEYHELEIYAELDPIEYHITYTNTKDNYSWNPENFDIYSEPDGFELEDIWCYGYNFLGWYNGDERVTFISTEDYDDLTLEARWIPIEYEIEYRNTYGAENLNPDGYNVDDFPVILSEIEREGYDFLGWYDDEYYGNQLVELPSDYLTDWILYAYWTPINYNITYTNTKEATNQNPTQYNIESNTINLKNLTCDGYIFDGWYNGDERVTQIPRGSVGNITLEARWTENDYLITYTNTKGAANPNPNGFNINSETIILSDLEKDGYIFEGWYKGQQQITEITKGTIGNIILSANWTPKNYNITYTNIKGATNQNPTQYNIESNTINLENLTCDGYIFDGWYNGDERVTQIPRGSVGNITLEARWTENDYLITYTNTKGAANPNPNGFNINSETIILSDLKKEGYIFDGWYKGEEKVVQIPRGTVGNLSLAAKWTPIVYSINYVDTKGASNSNPKEFTVESSTITLKSISSIGYTFDGWYQGNTRVYKISSGTIGNQTLTAKWTPVTYSITYKNTYGVYNPNPERYAFGSELILLNIEREGYYFEGWYYEDGMRAKKIEIGAAGNRVLEAKWTPKTYSVIFNADGETVAYRNFTLENTTELSSLPNVPEKEGYSGKWSNFNIAPNDIIVNAEYSPITYSITYENLKEASNSNPLTYNIEDEIILSDISCDGYDFDGWYNGDERITSIEYGNIGNITLIARWTPKEYNITFEDTKNAVNNNPTSYNIESDTITLTGISKTGYAFEGWYNGDKKITSIASGSKGDIVLTAKWTLVNYKITYTASSYADILSHKNPTTYNIESSFDLTETTIHSSYVFGGWYKDGVKITAITPGMTGDITLKASLTFTGTTITTKAGFEAIAYNPAGAYRLGANITITASICSSSTPFYGHFYGNGYTITGATPFAQNNGYIARLKVVKGGIANYNRGKIYRCSATGYAQYNDSTGGIVGYNSGTVSQCYHPASMTSVSGRYVGGIVGQNLGTVEDCYHTGSISPSSGSSTYYYGGIVGYNYTGGSVTRCYATGYIKNIYAEASGGIVGLQSGSITNCISTCTCDESFSFGVAGTSGGSFSNNYHSGPAVSTYYSTSVDAANLKNSSFITGRLYWSTDVWRLVSGKEPVLAWQ